jgi:hypothetical protein
MGVVHPPLSEMNRCGQGPCRRYYSVEGRLLVIVTLSERELFLGVVALPGPGY